MLDVIEVEDGDRWLRISTLVINSYLANRLRFALKVEFVNFVCKQTRSLVHVYDTGAIIGQIIVILRLVTLNDPLANPAEIVFL